MLQLPVSALTALMTQQQNWASIGLGQTGDSYLVAPDGVLLTALRPELVDNNAFYQQYPALQQHKGAFGLSGNLLLDNTEVKHTAGGVVDLEFISQYLVLGYAATFPALYQYSDNIRILDAAVVAGLMSADQALLLQQAYQDLRAVSHRLTLEPATTANLPDLRAAMQQVQTSWVNVLGTSTVLPH